jgi:hypothetical protein
MSVAPTATRHRITIRAVPAPKRTGTPERIGQTLARCLAAVESGLFDATCELVYQRDDLVEACSDINNRALAAALRVEGLPPLARELIQVALAAEDAEDAAVRRAERRRAGAHGYQRDAIGRIEVLLTDRRPDVQRSAEERPHHAPGTDLSDHDCRAPIYADCRACGRRVELCSASKSQVDAILALRYRCPACEAPLESRE